MTESMLNLGCGTRFHRDWVNVNFTYSGDGVILANLREGIPFPDNFFSVVYHSHLLEHFSKKEGEIFLSECYRVLQPGGWIRIAVPDLESIVREYLVTLKNAKDGKFNGQKNYEWIMLEMYDQVVRNHSGGEMADYLSQKKILNEDFVIARCGLEVKNLIEVGKKKFDVLHPEFYKKKSIRRKILDLLLKPQVMREHILDMLLGDEYKTLQIGRFRLNGENHQWMYDSYSLGIVLKNSGFENIIVRSASESYIPNWTSFNLDTEPDGSVYKPDSLYIEATKN